MCAGVVAGAILQQAGAEGNLHLQLREQFAEPLRLPLMLRFQVAGVSHLEAARGARGKIPVTLIIYDLGPASNPE